MTFLFLCFHPYFLLTLIFVAVDILWKYWCSGFLFVLRSIWINWHVDVVVLSVRGVTYEKKTKKQNGVGQGTFKNTHGCIHISDLYIPPFSLNFSFLQFSHYILPFFFSFFFSPLFCWRKTNLSTFFCFSLFGSFSISFACFATSACICSSREGFGLFLNMCMQFLTSCVCHYSKHTLSPTHTMKS